MKRMLFILSLVLISIVAMGQEPKKFEYSQVEQVDGMTSEQIYKAAKVWFVNVFKDANSVIQVDDPSEFDIIGKGCSKYIDNSLNYSYSSGYIYYVIEIKAKDGRYKISLSDFTHESNTREFKYFWSLGPIYIDMPTSYKGQQKKIFPKIKGACIDDAISLALSAKDFILKNKDKQDADDNW